MLDSKGGCMSFINFNFRGFWMLALGLVLAACGANATPQLIGSYPQTGEAPIAYYQPPAVPRLTITYHASLELEVENTGNALYSVQWIASQNYGYLLNSRTWRESSLTYGEATIAVPASRFDAARSALRGLGTVREESISGELKPVDGYEAGWEGYSNITVSLRPAAASWGRQALRGATGVLQFAWWVATVVLPPALMVIGLVTVVRWAGRRLRPRPE
jgi:hypothetical protein